MTPLIIHQRCKAGDWHKKLLKSPLSLTFASMTRLVLPPSAGVGPREDLPPSHTYLVTGANGSGKSRFLDRLAADWAGEARKLSVMSDSLPLHTDPCLEELACRLASAPQDVKEQAERVWAHAFPGSALVFGNPEEGGTGLEFANASAPGTFGARRLGRGEQCALAFMAGVLLAPGKALLLVDAPSLFMHPSVSKRLWDLLEELRRDCTIVYDTSDPVFAASREGCVPIWVHSYDPVAGQWAYQVVCDRDEAPDEMLAELLGSRRPVLFTEGDRTHSIDCRLYGALFPQYDIRPVGSCDKVIESTRSFGFLQTMHRMECRGLVDRDRRSDQEVAYLRRKGIMVPETAEVENLFLDPGVVGGMAVASGRDPQKTVRAVSREILEAFRRHLDAQALEHTRHIMKREAERRIDGRFTCITALELHIRSLADTLRPRDRYREKLQEFRRLLTSADVRGVLRVFNHKPLLTQSCVVPLLGYKSAARYIEGVIRTVKGGGADGGRVREALRALICPGEESLANGDDFTKFSTPAAKHTANHIVRNIGKTHGPGVLQTPRPSSKSVQNKSQHNSRRPGGNGRSKN